MDLISEILKQLEILRSISEVTVTPTVYLGQAEMKQLRSHMGRAFTRPSGEFIEPSVLGMPLVEVLQDHYLRVV